MTYQEAYDIVEKALLGTSGWFPENTYRALDVLRELVREVADEEPIGYGLEIGQR